MKKTLLLPFAGLAALAFPSHATAQVTSITYETSACFGTCPVYRVTVNANGTGIFEGRHHTAVTGRRRFRLSAAQFRAFASHLAPLRPARGAVHYDGPPRCRAMATDQSSVDVRWRGPSGEQELDVYFGCDMEANRVMIDRLVRAPALLPIRDFIGRRR
jgi:hypothetical protein